MIITNKKIVEFVNAPFGQKKLPVRLAYAIAVNLEAMAVATKAYEEQRKNLIDKHVVKDEEGNPVIENDMAKLKDAETWEKDIFELMETEVEIPITKVPVEVLDKCDEDGFDSLSIMELMIIDFMIK